MPITGPLTHIDISIGYPERSIPFYSAFFQVLGYQRCAILLPEWQEPNPIRATWSLAYANGARFEVELRPARSESRDRKYDRYEPGLHHLAFHAESRAVVDRLFQVMREVGDTILDPPTDYGGQTGYDEGYYAVFLVDPDGMKLEVAYIPRANP